MSRFNYVALAQDLSALIGRRATESEARAVKRDIARHHSLAEASCNGELTPRQEANERGVEHRLMAFFGPERLAGFSGDPRGATVKLIDPREGPLSFTYFSRDWGGNLIFVG